jgi:hypothetical protein
MNVVHLSVGVEGLFGQLGNPLQCLSCLFDVVFGLYLVEWKDVSIVICSFVMRMFVILCRRLASQIRVSRFAQPSINLQGEKKSTSDSNSIGANERSERKKHSVG